jgi:undecaprenyl-diphosphatase
MPESVAHAIVLGIVQGLSEFLPISSKTHLVVVPALLGWRPPSLRFVVFLHMGTLAALLAYYLRDLWSLLTASIKGSEQERRTVGLLVVATIPAVVAGLVLESTVERLLRHTRAAALALLATSAILAAAEWAAGTIRHSRRLPRPTRARPAWRDAIGMGLAQAVALLPGVSRSGSTMGAGLALGLDRPAAARFSFLMAVPAVAGAGVLELPKLAHGGLGAAGLAGFAASLVSGYVAIGSLLRWLRSHSFMPFAAYCLVFGLAAAALL